MGGSDWVCGGMHESSSTESAPEGGVEGLLESGGTDTEHGCEAEVQSDRGGGRTDPASEKEGEATTVRGAASVSVREAVQGGSLWVGEEEADGRRLEFNSVSEVMNTVVLQVG